MTALLEWMQSTMSVNMMIALLHTLWQGLTISLILYVILKNIPSGQSVLRYRLSILSMLLIVIFWLGTFSILQYEPPASETNTNSVSAEPQAEAALPPSSAQAFRQQLPETTPQPQKATQPSTVKISTEQDVNTFKATHFSYIGWLILFWLSGVCFMLGRIFFALAGAAKLKRDTVELEDPAVIELFEQLCRQMNIRRRIRMAASKTLLHPGVIGFWRPVLLVPLSILSEISTEDLRSILAHELAHIRRLDYLVNLCQMLIEAVLFFNPAVWWVSRQIRIEREACCDMAGVEVSGRRIDYAKVLFEQICRTAKFQPAVAAAIAGFSDGNNQISAERVKRVIDPRYKPHIKIGSAKLTLWISMAAIVLLGLWKTTDITIAMAAEIMTPAERVEAMKQINDQYSTEETKLYAEDEKITVRGQLMTADSGFLPIRTGENCQGTPSTWIDIDMELSPYEEGHGYPELNTDGTFEFRTRLKRFYIIVRPRKDYAVGFFGPFEFEPGQIAEGLQLTLDPGFSTEMIFVNEQNETVPGVNVSGGYPVPPGYGGYHYTLNSVSGNDGVALFEHVADEVASFRCEVPGYVKESRQKIRLQPDVPYLWQLTSAPATKVCVISDQTGQPIEGAAVNLRGKQYSQIESYWIQRPVFIADNDGWIEMSSLSPSESYLALVHAEGYQRQYTNIRAGDEMVIRLAEFKPVKGKITGDLSGLLENEKGTYFEFGNSVRTGLYSRSSHWTGDNKVYVEMKDGQAYFQIDKYFGHELELRIGPKTHTVNVDTDDISNVTIDIPLPTTYETQKMTFNFVDAVTSQTLPFTGKFNLSYRDNPNEHYTKKHDIEIVDGKAEVEMKIPNHISIEPTSETGWFFYRQWKKIEADYTGTETIKCYPAGAIFGKITNPAEEYSRIYMSIHIAKKSPLLEKNRSQTPIVEFDDNIDLAPEGSYYIGPIPLEGEYTVSVSDKNLYWFSDEIKLTEDAPLHELNITLPTERIDLRGQLLDPEGNPISAVGFKMHTNTRYGGRTYSDDRWSTDSGGYFELKGFNPDRSIDYTIWFDAPGFVSKWCELNIRQNNRITLERGLTVEGTIYDKDTNKPVPGVQVEFWATEKEGGSFQVMTNAKGQFIANQFADMVYNYRLQKEGYQGVYYSSDNHLDPSKDRDVKLYLPRQKQ